MTLLQLVVNRIVGLREMVPTGKREIENTNENGNEIIDLEIFWIKVEMW